MNLISRSTSVLITCLLCLVTTATGLAHDKSLERFLAQRKRQIVREARRFEPVQTKAAPCRLTVQLIDPTTPGSHTVPGLIRIQNRETKKYLDLKALIKRDNHWFVIPGDGRIDVTQGDLQIECISGIERLGAKQNIVTAGREKATVQMELPTFYDAGKRGWRSGNTHLHLMRLTMTETLDYLHRVPQADDLDLVFVSHLLRAGDDRRYTSNLLTRGDLRRLSENGIRYGNGEEHRHNFGAYGEGYGHVMMLDLLQLIQPVSIGPGIMKEGTDGIPLQRGIRRARRDGATIIWCHNTYGMEDLPNWAAGLVHAQNIFDGGQHGSYAETFYRYLDIGMQVPFSTGTDWFIYDFSRVYVPDTADFTAKSWLSQLRKGRSFITNGTFLEFEINGQPIGSTLELTEPGTVHIKGKAIGRGNFKRLELIHNGRPIARIPAQEVNDHFEAVLDEKHKMLKPGWFALRVAVNNNQNEFGRNMFAHTSPIYIQVGGRGHFRAEVAEAMIKEIRQATATIREKGKFADSAETSAVLDVYEQGITDLRKRIRQHAGIRLP